MAGFYLGSKAFVAAIMLLLLRILIKVTVSELMYRRAKAVIREGIEDGGNTQ